MKPFLLVCGTRQRCLCAHLDIKLSPKLVPTKSQPLVSVCLVSLSSIRSLYKFEAAWPDKQLTLNQITVNNAQQQLTVSLSLSHPKLPPSLLPIFKFSFESLKSKQPLPRPPRPLADETFSFFLYTLSFYTALPQHAQLLTDALYKRPQTANSPTPSPPTAYYLFCIPFFRNTFYYFYSLSSH